MTTAAAILTALLFLPAYAGQERRTPGPPIQVVTTPTSRHVALIAVDGLSVDIARARPEFQMVVIERRALYCFTLNLARSAVPALRATC